MTIADIVVLVDRLKILKTYGGAKYNKASKLLRMEATTHNLEEAERLIAESTIEKIKDEK